MKRLRVGVVYGGRSSEHEVSLASAASIFGHLDRERYEPVPIRIERDGRWALADRPPTTASAAAAIEGARAARNRLSRAGREVHLAARPGDETLLTLERGLDGGDTDRAIINGLSLDVLFPIVHGPYGEDGTLQGLLELANVPYVGAGVLAAAVGMDKAVMKVLFAAAGLPIVAHEVVLRSHWRADRTGIADRVTARLRGPLFVKPANLGSSVGITRVDAPRALPAAVDHAAEFDRKIVVEEAVSPCREIECAVIGNDAPEASLPGEILPAGDFYDYEAKYLDTGSRTVVPADLPAARTAEVQRLALAAFRAIDGAGMARVDFLIDPAADRILVNEINTHPGFTSISMFAKLWEASGLSYSALLDRLITLALERHADKQQTRTTVT